MQGGWNNQPRNQLGQQGPNQFGQNNQRQQQVAQTFDFNRISEMPSKYPRKELPEVQENN